MKLNSIFFASVLGAFVLSACQVFGKGDAVQAPVIAASAGLPLTTSVVFQADLVGCKRSVLNLYRQTGPTDFQPVDRLVFVDGRVRDQNGNTYNAKGRDGVVHLRAMLPGKYHIRSMSCGKRAPRDEFAIGSFDVIEGRVAYIGKLVVGKDDGRVLLRVDNEAEAAYNGVRERHPDILPQFGVRLLVSNIPAPV